MYPRHVHPLGCHFFQQKEYLALRHHLGNLRRHLHRCHRSNRFLPLQKGCPRQALRSAYPVHILRSGHRHLYRPKADHCLDRHKACRRHNLHKAYPVLFLRRHRRHRRPQLEDHRQDHLSEYRCPHLHEAYLCQSRQKKNLISAFTTVQDVIAPVSI